MQLQCALLRGCSARDLVAVERTCRHYHTKFEDSDASVSLPSLVAKYACQQLRWSRVLLLPGPRAADGAEAEDAPAASWAWQDWKDEYMLAVSEPAAGMRLPDGSTCFTPKGELQGEERAAMAVQDLPRDASSSTVVSPSEAMPALLIALQARDQKLLETALLAGVAKGQGTEKSCVAGTESLWLAIDQQPPNLAAVATLLRYNTDPNKRLETGIGSLHFAIYGGVDDRGGAANPALLRALAVQTLLAGGADRDVRGKPYRLWAEDVDCGESDMISALSAALDQQNWYAVAALIGHGVQPSAEERRRMGAPLLEALKVGDI